MEGEFGHHNEFIPEDTECYEVCDLARKYKDVHHLYFPEADYQTRVEKKFRDLGENLIRGCRCKHMELHEEIEQPDKPVPEYMIWRIKESDEHISVRLRKEMEQYE